LGESAGKICFILLVNAWGLVQVSFIPPRTHLDLSEHTAAKNRVDSCYLCCG